MKVDIKNNTITLEKDGSRYCYWFDDIELLPDTCRGLKYLTTGELQFNVQGKQAPLTDNTSDEDMYRGKQFTFQNKMVERIQLYQNKWFCTVCQQRILKPSWYKALFHQMSLCMKKTNNSVSDQVRHKPPCTLTEES